MNVPLPLLRYSDAIAPVGDEQIVVTVVIVVADAAALAPAGARRARLSRVTSVNVPSRLFLYRRLIGAFRSPFASKRVPFTRKMSSQPSLS